MADVALLGDSIFDNKIYVGTEPDVRSHLSTLAPSDWNISLRAVDGSLIENVAQQLSGVENEVTHIVISTGGNNVLMNADILQINASHSAEILTAISDRATGFEKSYNSMLSAATSGKSFVAVCTIYFPNFPEPSLQKIAVAALSVFNDAIIRQATLFGLPILDLRLVCNEVDDYANEIEPSGRGGKKIAAAILKMIRAHDFSKATTQIYF